MHFHLEGLIVLRNVEPLAKTLMTGSCHNQKDGLHGNEGENVLALGVGLCAIGNDRPAAALRVTEFQSEPGLKERLMGLGIRYNDRNMSERRLLSRRRVERERGEIESQNQTHSCSP